MDCKIGMQSRQCFMEKIRMLLESMYITSDRRFRKRICNERSDKRSDVITIFQKKKKSATRKKIFWKASRSRKDETNTALLGNILLPPEILQNKIIIFDEDSPGDLFLFLFDRGTAS